MYELELNIDGLDGRLVDAMKDIGRRCAFDVFYHGYDHLVFKSDFGKFFSKMFDELSNVCQAYGVNYVDLIV